MTVRNGRVPTTQMRLVDGWAWLAPGAAAAWLLFAFACQMRWGVRPTITRPDGAYRSLARQTWWWVRRFIFGVVVARPGTSNHGLGMAIDVYNWARFPRAEFVALARRYGFIFDTPSEKWHMRYTGAPNYTTPTPAGSVPVLLKPEEAPMLLFIYDMSTQVGGKSVESTKFAICGGSPGTEANAYECFTYNEAKLLKKQLKLGNPLGYNHNAYLEIIRRFRTPVA